MKPFQLGFAKNSLKSYCTNILIEQQGDTYKHNCMYYKALGLILIISRSSSNSTVIASTSGSSHIDNSLYQWRSMGCQHLEQASIVPLNHGPLALPESLPPKNFVPGATAPVAPPILHHYPLLCRTVMALLFCIIYA